ncbi:MAG TPA: nicotinamide-nucleotide amidohydrolase family protein [Tepidisphaeraceae bacterium]|jgi:nicotinamide-nucleotide amidase
MQAFILSIGDELALGQTVDTNSAWISQQLAAVGCDVLGHQTVADRQSMIEASIRTWAAQADVLIVSGGIGPTEDDLTRQAIASVLGSELVLDESWLAHMKTHFTSRGREMPERNVVQAMIPRGATMLWNTAGTAAGIRAEVRGEGQGVRRKEEAKVAVNAVSSSRLTPHASTLFSVPGVPREMKAMFTRDVLPWVRERSGGAVILQAKLHTFGLGESAIGERLGGLMDRGRNPSVGTTVANGLVSLRVNARFPSLEEGQRQLDETIAACRAALGPMIFGQGDDTLEGVVMSLLASGERPITVATAESCTGGWLAKMLTDLPGSSRYFHQGWVTYTNESKTAQLGVKPLTLAAHGAVSEPTVAEMAEGARQRAGTDIALSVSGIAGPDGGTSDKPVGTVCFGLAHIGGTLTRTLGMFGDRDMVRDRSAKMALTLLRFHLMGHSLPF